MRRYRFGRRSGSRLLSLVVFLSLVVLVTSGGVLASVGKGTSPRIGFRAPVFTVKDLAGQEVSLAEQMGQPVFINFFATWCTFCRVEMPYIQTLYEELGDEISFMIIDLRESKETVEAFFEAHKLTVPVYLDPTGTSGARYGVRGIPASYFIDTHGVIQDMVIGAMSEERLRQGLESIAP
ncbi:MAG: redoxin domain-containing protein [Firmicutes bacterium]|nr:redoxin domain-containing protein [Bacillota bacterium]